MTALYGFFAVVGGVLALVMLIGLGDSDADLDADLDLDVDADLDVAGEGMAAGAGSVLQSLFSVRTLIFAGAFFGITGLVMPLAGAGNTATFISALAVGGFAGYVNDRLIRYVKRTSGGIGDRLANMAGLPARVTLPLEIGRRGQIIVEVEGRNVRLVAEPYRDVGHRFDQGDAVVVVEVDNGVARVAPLEFE